MRKILLISVLLAMAFTAFAQDTEEQLQQLINLAKQPSTIANDLAVEATFAALRDAARANQDKRNYYYAYNITRGYYHRNNKNYRAYELLEEMQRTALQERDAYGIWTSCRFLAALYIEQNDYSSAKTYLQQAIQSYNTTTDPVVRRQSPTRLYCDLADTYPVGSDSARLFVQKAVQGAKAHADTLRCRYYQARISALDGDWKQYRQWREYCLNDPAISVIAPHAGDLFFLIDAVNDGTITRFENRVLALSSVREIKFIAAMAEQRGYRNFTLRLQKELVQMLEVILSQNNRSKISELDVTMGKAALSADLVNKDHRYRTVMHLLLTIMVLFFGICVLLLILHVRNLTHTNREVEEANAAKTRFVQNMSHEIRTPLNAVVGFAQLLTLPDGSLSAEEKEEFGKHIINNSQMLTMLLDDILNVSAMSNGDYNITYGTGELHTMAREAMNSSEHRLQPGVVMEYRPAREEPFFFTTDPRRVQQILISLLTNACKHTPSGSITVTSAVDELPGYVTYAVTDTGHGVPPEHADIIFERFTKLNSFVPGTGLGLSICRDLATLLGANVFLDTQYTQGARFVLQVPIQPPENTTTNTA